MASESEDHATNASFSSSDDECLSAVKRKAENKLINEKKIKYDVDSDDEPIMAGVLVTVEVEELDDSTCPLEFNNHISAKTEKTKSKKNKKNKKSKQKPNKQPQIFRCIECDMILHSTSELKTHSLEHQVKTRHKCEDCGRYFKKAFSLRMHRKVHDNRMEECPICNQKFTHRIGLGRHMTSHERTEACDQCHAKFHTTAQLANHTKQAHSKRKDVSRKKSKTNQMIEPETVHSEIDRDDVKNEIETEDEVSKPPLPFGYTEFTDSLKREDLSHSTQCAIVSKMHKGRTVADVCRLYNLTAEVVNEIWEDRDKYSVPKKTGKRATTYMNRILDARIVEWFHKQKANDIQVSGKMLQDIAEAFAKDCGFVAFNGSKKWLDRFKQRYNITLRGTPNKRDYHNQLECKWKNHFFKEQWSDARLGFPDEDIYTADEFGFFYNPSKGRIKKLVGKKFIQGCVKDRLSVFLCANMPGSDKRKLLVCGTEDPLVHSFRDPDTLPVTYLRHSQAHFTTQMFEEYVKYWNKELQGKNRRAILVLDRATIHSKLQLSHLKLVFVPWKASNGLVPMKNGVSAKFREEFRRLVLEDKAMNVLTGIDRNLTCLEALNMLAKAWERVSPEVITKSFLDTGYDVTMSPDESVIEKPKVYENDEEILSNMLKDYDVETYYTSLSTLDQYLMVDEELVTGQGTNGSVFGGNHKVVDPLSQVGKEEQDLLPIATEKPETVEKEVLVKKSRALQDLDVVRKYLQSSDTTYDTFCCFMEIEKFVMQTVLS